MYLFGAQLVGGDNLDSQIACVHEAERIQHNLSDQRVVRHHHGHRAEQHLQVIREFRATGIPGVHGDADVTVGVQLQLGSLKRELSLFRSDGSLDA